MLGNVRDITPMLLTDSSPRGTSPLFTLTVGDSYSDQPVKSTVTKDALSETGKDIGTTVRHASTGNSLMRLRVSHVQKVASHTILLYYGATCSSFFSIPVNFNCTVNYTIMLLLYIIIRLSNYILQMFSITYSIKVNKHNSFEE